MEVATEVAMEAVDGMTEADVIGASALLAVALALHHEAVETMTIARAAHATAITNEVDLAATIVMTDAASGHAARRQNATEATVIAT